MKEEVPLKLWWPIFDAAHHLLNINTSPPEQNGCHLADGIFKYIFLNKKFHILIWISLKIFLKIPIDNKLALDQVMPWCQISDKPLPEPLLTQFTDTYMQH